MTDNCVTSIDKGCIDWFDFWMDWHYCYPYTRSQLLARTDFTWYKMRLDPTRCRPAPRMPSSQVGG